ncbi:MAG: hypothetical protein KC619_22585 [Myxococcales bacterium]|nr:hypothetical protein [Myxococcales bacterium]
MVWWIHEWSSETRRGSVASPHFGPWGFGPAENATDTDFEVGEEVLVTLDGPKDAYVVRSVVPARQRQPAGTEWPEMADVGRSGDVRVEELTEDALVLWAGDCCEHCGPSWRVTFRRPRVRDLDEGSDLDLTLFRLATDEEVREAGLEVPDESRAYCLVTLHGQGPDGPRFVVVAERVDVERIPARGW